MAVIFFLIISDNCFWEQFSSAKSHYGSAGELGHELRELDSRILGGGVRGHIAYCALGFATRKVHDPTRVPLLLVVLAVTSWHDVDNACNSKLGMSSATMPATTNLA